MYKYNSYQSCFDNIKVGDIIHCTYGRRYRIIELFRGKTYRVLDLSDYYTEYSLTQANFLAGGLQKIVKVR